MQDSDNFYTVSIENTQESFTISKQYKLIRKVGSGSYGSVCSALNLNTNEVVAIKKCHHIFDKKLITKRCLREMKLLQHFNGHPRIIDLKAMDIVDPATFNEVYLIQSCCDTTMADIIHSKVQLEPVHYQWFMYQLFSALKYIHSANVLHRDLKPANVLVNENCDLRICDFGMARGFIKPSAQVETQNMTHYVVTRWYRAPEIMLSGNSYDQSIDMWSVGCIFAELLGGKVLFKGNDYVDQLHKIIGILGLPRDTSFWNHSSSVTEYIRGLRDVNGQPPPEESIDFSILFPQCPPEGIDLLKRLLMLDPSKRITANEALEHPFVAAVRDRSEELECKEIFDFESFEMIQSEHVLRQCIVEEKSLGFLRLFIVDCCNPLDTQ
ncbi:Pkinase-domain-containing protein [Backusella circina FSU 941]|nr:Pkinase-domain-containing protein [Backusella circina FSU 941]